MCDRFSRDKCHYLRYRALFDFQNGTEAKCISCLMFFTRTPFKCWSNTIIKMNRFSNSLVWLKRLCFKLLLWNQRHPRTNFKDYEIDLWQKKLLKYTVMSYFHGANVVSLSGSTCFILKPNQEKPCLRASFYHTGIVYSSVASKWKLADAGFREGAVSSFLTGIYWKKCISAEI